MKRYTIEMSERMLALLVLASGSMSRNPEVLPEARIKYARVCTEITQQAIKQGGFNIDSAWQEDDL